MRLFRKRQFSDKELVELRKLLSKVLVQEKLKPSELSDVNYFMSKCWDLYIGVKK